MYILLKTKRNKEKKYVTYKIYYDTKRKEFIKTGGNGNTAAIALAIPFYALSRALGRFLESKTSEIENIGNILGVMGGIVLFIIISFLYQLYEYKNFRKMFKNKKNLEKEGLLEKYKITSSSVNELYKGNWKTCVICFSIGLALFIFVQWFNARADIAFMINMMGFMMINSSIYFLYLNSLFFKKKAIEIVEQYTI